MELVCLYSAYAGGWVKAGGLYHMTSVLAEEYCPHQAVLKPFGQGWEEGSVGKCLLSKYEDLSLDSQHPCKSQESRHTSVSPVLGEQRLGDPGDLLGLYSHKKMYTYNKAASL